MKKPIKVRTKIEAVIALCIIGSLICASVVFSSTTKLGVDSVGDEWTFGWGMIRNSNDNTYQNTVANVFNAIYNLNSTGGTVWLPPEIFLIDQANGIKLYHNNITIIGYGCTLRKAEPVGSTVGQVFEIIGADNITIKGITFDQDKDNANHDSAAGYGLQWVARIGSNSKNIHIDDCSFINGEENGIVTGGNTSNIFITNCFFDGFGEHPFYLDRTSNFFVDNCIVLNWAKFVRGYGPKVMRSDNIHFTDCYFEQNEDGTGHPVAGGLGDYGAYGAVLSNTNYTIFTRCEWKGDGSTNYDKSVVNIDDTTLNTSFLNCRFDNMGVISVNPSISIVTTSEMIGCYFNSHSSGQSTKVFPLMKDCLIVDPYYIHVDVEHTKLVDCKIVNSSNQYHGWLMDIRADDVGLYGCEFYNWDYRGPYFNTGLNGSVINCYWNRGTTSAAIKINSGTRMIGNYFDDVAGTGYTVGASGSGSIFTNNYIASTLNNNDFRAALDKFSMVANNMGLDCLIIPTANITSVSDVPGRMWFDTVNHRLYICESSGVWKHFDADN